MTSAAQPTTEVLPALGLLSHRVQTVTPAVTALLETKPVDVLLIDARRDLSSARSLTRLVAVAGVTAPVIAILTEGGLAALSEQWYVDDVLLDTAGPAEVEARLRLAGCRRGKNSDDDIQVLQAGDVSIDESTYTARLRGRPIDLTYKEFELLKFLVQHAGRVFSRSQLLQEVWGYDYFGGTRTVDVHIRRLRAKLGPEYEALIGTVRNVGYKFERQPPTGKADTAPALAER